MSVIRRITAREEALFDELCDLLKDVVDGGASVNFLAPLDRGIAERYWEGVFASLGPELALWVAEENGRVVGSVQLALCRKPNGPHRAEVMKLLVRSDSRGQGIARRLMTEMEDFARADGRTLLLLDTEVDSPAETVYQRLGWTRAGEIPDFALRAYGGLTATAYYYKRL